MWDVPPRRLGPGEGYGPATGRRGAAAPQRRAARSTTDESETMAGSVNKVILVGNLGRDPEVRSNQDGTKIVNFTLATSEPWPDKSNGERSERTGRPRVVILHAKPARNTGRA